MVAVDRGKTMDICRQLGAVATIDFDTEDVKDRIKEITGEGADVVLDPVGGSAQNKHCARPDGAAGLSGSCFASGDIPKIPLNLVLLKGVVIKGYEARTFPVNRPQEHGRRGPSGADAGGRCKASRGCCLPARADHRCPQRHPGP